jgi:hypothetical protein
MNLKNALTSSEVGNYLIRFYEAVAKKGLKVGESDVAIQSENSENDCFGALFFMHGDNKIYVCPAQITDLIDPHFDFIFAGTCFKFIQDAGAPRKVQVN